MRETVRYWGVTDAERRAAFDSDAAARVAAGWQVVGEVTDWPVGKPGLDLVVTYELADRAAGEPAETAGATPFEAPTSAPAGKSILSMAWESLPYLVALAVIVAAANFAWFMFEAVTVGDALNGYEKGGHYFVMNKPGYTEVSRQTWDWLRFHATTAFAGVPFAILGGAWYGFRIDWPRQIAGAATPAQTRARADAIKRSGPLMTSSRPGGIVGPVRMSGPLLRVSVYPAGIVIKPVFMAEHAIFAQEITAVTSKRWWRSWAVEVAHAGVDVKSPLILYVKPESAILSAIRWIAGPNGEPAQKPPFVWPKSIGELANRVFAPTPVRRTGPPIMNVVQQAVGLTWRAAVVLVSLVLFALWPNPVFLLWAVFAAVYFIRYLRGTFGSPRLPPGDGLV